MNHVRRLAGLLLVAVAFILPSCNDSIVQPDATVSNARIFDELWSDVDLHYPFFELKHLNWDSLGTVYRAYALKAADKGALQAALATLLRELHDPHVVLFEDYGPYPVLPYLGRADTLRKYFDLNFVLRHYVTTATYSSSTVIHAGMITSDIGYVQIGDFLGGSELAQLDAALATLTSAKTLLVDVRTNIGGNYQLAIDMAGRFVQQRATFGYLRFRNGHAHDNLTSMIAEEVVPAGAAHSDRSVYLLTDPATASSAEVFTLAVRTNQKVTVVGDTTAGVSGGPTARELSNGWVYRISEWIEFTPARVTYETIGLPPDLFVKSRESDMSRGIDAVVEAALALARSAP